MGIIAGLYALGLPAKLRRSMPILPGAALAAVLQALLGVAYGLFIHATGDGSAYLAGLATIGVTMTFVYISVLSVLLGLAANQSLRLAHIRLARRHKHALANSHARALGHPDASTPGFASTDSNSRGASWRASTCVAQTTSVGASDAQIS